jgi:Zinc finger, C3HC4 type (RING finger)
MNDDFTSAWLGRKEDFSYPGWEQDYETAEQAFAETQAKNGSPNSCTECLDAVHRLHEKQRVHDGDRSHPRLVSLDRLSLTLGYPGWEEDVCNAEQAHFNSYYNVDSEKDIYFQSKLEGLENRQQLYYGYSGGQHSSASSSISMPARSQSEIVAMLGSCVICGERNKTHLYNPCGHLCCCQSCANQVMRGTSPFCPVCRVPSTSTIRVFFT